MNQRSTHKGFSILESLVVVGIVGVLSALSYIAVTQVSKVSKAEKLRSDVSTINRAVMLFQASGGNLGELDEPKAILNRLRSAALATQANRLPGFSSSTLDPRIAIHEQSKSEASSGKLRAHWNKERQRFVIAESGAPGIKDFYLDSDLAEDAIEEVGRNALLKYAGEDTWVWDYQDVAADVPSGPTVVVTSTPINSSLPVTPPVGSPPFTPPLVADLIPPIFTVPGGNHDPNTYDLSVELINPNPAGSSNLYYAINYGPWQTYNGPLVTKPDTTISAQSISTDMDRYRDSSRINQIYQTTEITLLPPIIQPSHTGFGLFYTYDIDVTLVNPNDPTVSLIQYRIEGGPWQVYGSPFSLTKAAYPDGAIIEAKSISSGSPIYLPSSVTASTLSIDSINLSGNTEGSFYNPLGPAGMVTNLGGGNRDSYFEWGDGDGIGRSKSTMNYAGGTFGNVGTGVRFDAGLLTYYNGTILANSGANTIDLDVTLSLDINGNLFNPFFGYTFDLINTPNDVSDPWGSADYVRLNDAVASRTIVINDYEYEFLLEFGETTASGFSEFNEFHVLENETASVQLYGTLIAIGEVGGASGGTQDTAFDKTIIDATVPEAVTQRDGYVDDKEYSTSLLELTKDNKEDAKDDYEDAKDAASVVLKGAQDTQKKIDEGKYLEAEKLATAAAEAVIIAQEAALAAEEEAVQAKAALAAANAVAAADPENSSLQKIAAELATKAGETALFSIDAQIEANNALADAAIVAAAWDAFLVSGPNDDQEGFAVYLGESSALAKDTAKSSLSSAQSFADTAAKASQYTQMKIDEGKFDEAREYADMTIAAAIASEDAAQIAEAEAAKANAAAAQAASIAAANPGDSGMQNSADTAALFAVEAQGYANDARIAANLAADAELQVAALIVSIP